MNRLHVQLLLGLVLLAVAVYWPKPEVTWRYTAVRYAAPGEPNGIYQLPPHLELYITQPDPWTLARLRHGLDNARVTIIDHRTGTISTGPIETLDSLLHRLRGDSAETDARVPPAPT